MVGRSISHYRVLEKLGEGGMGVVYKARDTHLDRFVALKVLPPERVADAERKRRFVQEAKAASALNHPNIVTIHDIADEDGTDFIVMEYVAGKTLGQLISRKGLPLAQTLKYAVEMADALAAAHGAGIVHRDVKPTNVMVTDKGRVKVLDFGLAKLTEVAPPGEEEPTRTLQPQTEEGTIVGTVAYMSPEQASGKKTDGRSDIFSFGSVLYEMVTGRQAFHGDTKISTLAAIINQEPAPLGAEIPHDLEKLIARCLRKDPARRFQLMEDVKIALEELKEESDSGKLAPAAVARARRAWPLRMLVPGGVLVALLAAGLAWYYLRRAPQPVATLKEVLLTSYPGSEQNPSFSPDGSQVAFSWDGPEQHNFDIYVKLVAGGEPLRLTTNPAPDLAPAWSPDGRHIAFLRGNAVLLISPLGGPERKVMERAADPRLWGRLAWTPDGKSLVCPDRSPKSEPYALFLFSVATGETKKLTSPPGESYGDTSPAFSPDGKQLAFARWPTVTSGDVYVASAEGGEPRRLTGDETYIGGLSWTPDGRELVFSSLRGGSYNLWRIPVTASPPQPSRVVGAAGDAAWPTISKGPPVRLAYQRGLWDYNIWGVDTRHPQRAGMVPKKLIASTRAEWSAQFSPDGKKIVFTSNRTGHGEIWVCDSDGSNPVQLTSLETYSGTPRWSLDGKRIVFDSMFGPNREIMVLGAEGGAPRRLTTEPSQEWRPSWSRDGRWIYSGSNRSGSAQIWKMPAEGGAAVQVTKNGGYEAVESPDGRLLYYVKSFAIPSELWSVPVDGGEETLVFRPVWLGRWAVAQKGIYFLDWSVPSSSPVPIKFFSFATYQVTQIGLLEKAAPARATAAAFDVTGDGSSILYVRVDQAESDLAMIENFR